MVMQGGAHACSGTDSVRPAGVSSWSPWRWPGRLQLGRDASPSRGHRAHCSQPWRRREGLRASQAGDVHSRKASWRRSSEQPSEDRQDPEEGLPPTGVGPDPSRCGCEGASNPSGRRGLGSAAPGCLPLPFLGKMHLFAAEGKGWFPWNVSERSRYLDGSLTGRAPPTPALVLGVGGAGGAGIS